MREMFRDRALRLGRENRLKKMVSENLPIVLIAISLIICALVGAVAAKVMY